MCPRDYVMYSTLLMFCMSPDCCYSKHSKLSLWVIDPDWHVNFRARKGGTLCAVKMSKREFFSLVDRDRYMREIQSVACLAEHLNAVNYFRGWQQDFHFYIQMELCEAGNLRTLRRSLTRLNSLWMNIKYNYYRCIMLIQLPLILHFVVWDYAPGVVKGAVDDTLVMIINIGMMGEFLQVWEYIEDVA